MNMSTFDNSSNKSWFTRVSSAAGSRFISGVARSTARNRGEHRRQHAFAHDIGNHQQRRVLVQS